MCPLLLLLLSGLHLYFFHYQTAGDAAAEQNEKAHAELVLLADRRHSAVEEMIRVQERAAVSRTEALLERLVKQISELRKGEDQLKQLSLTEDHIYFLQVQQQTDKMIILICRALVNVVYVSFFHF